jgi:NAD(P)-dependent dehydrogenase (short-subunit alcohol dehydrogenase family)
LGKGGAQSADWAPLNITDGGESPMARTLGRFDDSGRLGAALRERYGLDILIGNMALLGPASTLDRITFKDWDEVMNVNAL